MLTLRRNVWEPAAHGLRGIDARLLGPWVGHRVPGNLFDGRGRLVLAAGAILGECHHQYIMGNRVFGGPQWFDGYKFLNPTVEHIIREERRREPRIPKHGMLSISFEIDWVGNAAL